MCSGCVQFLILGKLKSVFFLYILIQFAFAQSYSLFNKSTSGADAIYYQPRANISEVFKLDPGFVRSSLNLTGTPIIEKNFNKSMFKTHNSTMRDFVFVVTVNSERLSIFSYWLWWARIAGLSKFLVFAMDEKSAAKAISLELQTISPESLHRFSDKVAFRNRFFLSLLLEGVSFISMEANTFMLDLSSFSLSGKDIYLSARGPPPANSNERLKLHGELFGISATRGVTTGLDFMRRIDECFLNGTLSKKYLRRLLDHQSVRSATQLYQSCMEKSLWEMHRNNGKKKLQSISVLGADVVVNSHQLFKLNLPQSRGKLPAMVLIDEPMDAAAKVNLLRDWNLNLEERENSNPKVKHAPYVSHSSIAARPSSPINNIALTIRIITMDRPTSLKRLLTSLTKAHYDNDTVHIEFYVDKPKSIADQTKYQAVIDIVKAFKWKHGSVQRNFEKQNAGIFKMWVRPFTVKTDDSAAQLFLMVLEDDIEVSPFFYTWAKKVLITYAPHAEGNLYGFTIQRSHGIIGTKKGENWVESYHDKNVSTAAPFYRYQLLSTWGQIFFPRHWNAFVNWAVVAKNQVGFKPCIPYLVSNYWYQVNPQKIWSIWFNYFVYHSGLTNLYINFNHLSSVINYALLLNYRENGLHYSSKSNITTGIIKSIVPAKFINSSIQIKLPPISRIPLYNFFFNLVKNEDLLKHQWRFTSNCVDQCITNSK